MAKESLRLINKDKSKRLLPLLALSVVLFSCGDENLVYHDYQAIEGGVWKTEDSRSFEFETEDLSNLHNLYIGVRNTNDYGFHNLYVFVTMTLPDGKTVTDTVQCPIANPQTGEWYGDGVGNLWDNLIMFKQNAKFPMTGKYVFEIQQGMREDLDGVVDVGLKVERAESKGAGEIHFNN